MRWKKDPNAILPYTLDWGQWLNGDTISSVVWSVPSGLNSVTESNTTTTATITLSGGTVGKVYDVRCRIFTAAGKADDRTFKLDVAHR